MAFFKEEVFVHICKKCENDDMKVHLFWNLFRDSNHFKTVSNFFEVEEVGFKVVVAG
jgi:hypothetical protein